MTGSASRPIVGGRTATVLQFKRPAAQRVESKRAGGVRITGFAVAIESRADAVVFTADGIQLGLSPDQAEELSEMLIEAAADARARR